MKRLLVPALALIAVGVQAQTVRRQAAILGGGGDRGRCTVEITVDGAVEIAIRADDATVTNLKGQMPELRRFECSSRLPGNPIEFRFAPVSGRGRQELVRPAAGEQPAVVRIEDPQNGSDRYVFELTWRNEGPPMDRRDGGRRDDRDRRVRFTTDQAIDVCRAEVRRRLADRFRPDDINFREIRIDDAPGRGEWVVGTLEAGRDERRRESMRFSCSVDFEAGKVRDAQIDPVRRDR
jgi:hypothetical protein